MGEIYRSASVTGVRRLDDSTTRPVDKRARVPAEEVPKSRLGEGKATAGQPAAESNAAGPTEALTPATTGAGDFERLRDLSLIQKQRIVQLEEEREELLKDCSRLADNTVTLEQQLSARSDEEKKAAYEAGLLQAQEELKATEQAVADDLQKMRRLFEDNLQDHLLQIDELAIEIAFAALTRIVGEQFGNPDFTRAVVTRALQGVRDTQKLTVHLSPGDVATMERHKGELPDPGILSDIDYVADPRVTVGGCLIETDAGVWDARLETQLQRLRDAISQSIKDGAPDS